MYVGNPCEGDGVPFRLHYRLISDPTILRSDRMLENVGKYASSPEKTVRNGEDNIFFIFSNRQLNDPTQ